MNNLVHDKKNNVSLAGSFHRSLFTLAIPITLQQMMNSLVNIIDTVMVGRLGTVEIAAVALGNQVFFIYNLVIFGANSGSGIFIAQFWGKKDIPEVRKSLGLTLLFGLGAGLVFTLGALFFPVEILSLYTRDPEVIEAGAAYLRTLAPSFLPFAAGFIFSWALRSVEKVRLSMVTTIIALALNVVLNYLFIFGAGPIPAMGVVGAALATVISRLMEAIILISVSYMRRYPTAGSLGEFLGFKLPFVRHFFRIAAPVIGNEILWALGMSLQSLILARTNTEAIAAFNITNTVSQLTQVMFIGLASATGVIIGKEIGAGNEGTARNYASRAGIFSFLSAGAVAFLLFPLFFLMPHLFRVSDTVFSLIAPMFLILGLSYPLRSFNMTMVVGICRAGGDTIFCAIYDLTFLWFASLPLSALAGFYFGAPVWIIYLCLFAEDPLKFITGIWRLRSGKWLRNVTG